MREEEKQNYKRTEDNLVCCDFFVPSCWKTVQLSGVRMVSRLLAKAYFLVINYCKVPIIILGLIFVQKAF